jgi:hypothetical protein
VFKYNKNSTKKKALHGTYFHGHKALHGTHFHDHKVVHGTHFHDHKLPKNQQLLLTKSFGTIKQIRN